MTVRRGALIVLEGLDRTGKSTQGRALVDRLRSMGLAAELLRFPDRSTQVGKMIDQYLSSKMDLDDRVIHLLFSANRWEKEKEIRTLLNKGTTVIIDRYAFSGSAYSHAKSLDLNWCQAPDRGLPRPDHVFFLTLSPDAQRARGGFGDERYETTQFQQAVATAFTSVLENTSASVTIMDASESIEAVTSSLLDKVMKVLAQVGPEIKVL